MTIRSARPEDADFIAKTILSSMRGHRPRGWFDIALGWPEDLAYPSWRLSVGAALT